MSHTPQSATGSAAPHLSDCLRAGTRELSQQHPPPARDAAVLAAMRRALPRPQGLPESRGLRRWLRPLAWSGAASFALLLLGVGVLLKLEPPVPPNASAVASDFLPLVPPERWARYLEHTRAQPAWLVSTELPRERLALLGLPYDPAQAGAPVHAELLLDHPSGDVLALRVIR